MDVFLKWATNIRALTKNARDVIDFHKNIFQQGNLSQWDWYRIIILQKIYLNL